MAGLHEMRAEFGPEFNGAQGRSGLTMVFVARHGETLSNRQRRYAGSSPEPLTDEGRAQALGLAERVAALEIAEVRTSGIARAAETARIVAERLAVPVQIDARLNEMRMGPWEGLTEDEVAAHDLTAYRTWLETPDRLLLPGRESLKELAARVVPAVLDAASAGRRVLLISHVAPIRVAALMVLEIPLSAYKRLTIQNGDCLRQDLEAARAERLDGARPGSLRDEVTAGPRR